MIYLIAHKIRCTGPENIVKKLTHFSLHFKEMVANHLNIYSSRIPDYIYILKMGEHKHFASENKDDREKQNKKYKLKQTKNPALLDLPNVNLTPCETASRSHIRKNGIVILQFFDIVKYVQVESSVKTFSPNVYSERSPTTPYI